MPVSVGYFANMVINARDNSNFRNGVDRFSYFNQLIIVRKITDKFSAQVAPNFSWFNNVEAYIDKNDEIQKKMENGHFAISVPGRYIITEKSSIIAGYDQPLTQHTTNTHPILISVLVLKQLPVHMLSRYLRETIMVLCRRVTMCLTRTISETDSL
jgi:hypothetical protein